MLGCFYAETLYGVVTSNTPNKRLKAKVSIDNRDSGPSIVSRRYNAAGACIHSDAVPSKEGLRLQGSLDRAIQTETLLVRLSESIAATEKGMLYIFNT